MISKHNNDPNETAESLPEASRSFLTEPQAERQRASDPRSFRPTSTSDFPLPETRRSLADRRAR